MDPFKAEQIAPGAGGAGAPVRVRATEQIKVVPETVEETKVEEGAEIMEQQFNEAEIAYEIETDRNLTYLERRAKLRSEFLRCVTSNWPWVFTLGTFAVGLPIAIKTKVWWTTPLFMVCGATWDFMTLGGKMCSPYRNSTKALWFKYGDRPRTAWGEPTEEDYHKIEEWDRVRFPGAQPLSRSTFDDTSEYYTNEEMYELEK